MGMMRSSVGRYLRISLIATALVVGLPGVVGAITYLRESPDFRLQLAMLASAGICLAVVVGGSYFWKRRPESADVSFGELMLWRFFKRARAEERLNESARALGLDQGGRPLRRTQMSARERLKILHSLAGALESKDPYTHGHSTRVENLSVRTAEALGLAQSELDDLRTAALLHDVGKIRIPTRILRKPTRLTLEEKLVIQEHSSVGAWMVSGVTNRRVVTSVRHHHERWDGNGYPDGIGGREIPLLARIIAVADSYDAMTSSRPYRNSMSRDTALEELRAEAGDQFDPVVVDAFLESMPRRVVVPALVAPLAVMLGRSLRWARRLGSTQVAETMAGAGVAVVVAASVLVPHGVGPSEVNRLNRAPATTADQDAPIAADTLKAPAKQRQNVVLGVVVKRESVEHGSAVAEEKLEEAVAATASPPEVEPVSRGARAPGVLNPPPKPSAEPDASGASPPKTPAPPAPDEEDGEQVNTHGDPQPEHGRDCIDHPGQGEGGGNAKHCG